MAAVLPLWIVLALVIAYFGRRYRFGFWGYFLLSIFLTPVIGMLMLVAAIPKREQREILRRYSRPRS